LERHHGLTDGCYARWRHVGSMKWGRACSASHKHLTPAPSQRVFVEYAASTQTRTYTRMFVTQLQQNFPKPSSSCLLVTAVKLNTSRGVLSHAAITHAVRLPTNTASKTASISYSH
jgi:hypothetical protein